jgi:hypothetical protein
MPKRPVIEPHKSQPQVPPPSAPGPHLGWLAGGLAWHAWYLGAFYYLLAVDNAFNFNNNYPVLGFITALTAVVALAMLMLVVTSSRPLAAGQAGAPDADALATRFFIISLSMVAFLILPLIYYFMLLDDFAVTPRQWVSAGVALLSAWYAWRGWGRRLLTPRGFLPRAAFVVLTVALVLIMMSMLSDVIPTPMGETKTNVIQPL